MLIATGRAVLGKLMFDDALLDLLRGAGVFIAIRAGGGLLLYGSQVLLAQWLGTVQFGLFSQAWAWAYLLASLASLGLPNGALRFVPQYRARYDAANLLQFARWSRLMVAAAGAVVVLAGWLALSLGGHLLQPGVRGALFVAFLAIPVLAVSMLQVQMARAIGQIALAYAPEQLVRPSLFIGLGFAWLALGGRAEAAAFLLLTVTAFLIVTGLQGKQIARLLTAESRRACGVECSVDGPRHWLRTSLPMLAYSGALIALSESGIIMVGLMLTPGEVAVYAAAARTAMLLTMVTTAIDIMTVPKCAELNARGATGAINLLLRRAIRIAFLLASAMLVVVIVGGEFLLGLFGGGFTDGQNALVVLAGGITLGAALAPAPALLSVTGHQDIVTVVSLAAVALNLLLSVILISQFGLIGAALAHAATGVLLRAVLLGALRRRLGLFGLIMPPAFGRPSAGRGTSTS